MRFIIIASALAVGNALGAIWNVSEAPYFALINAFLAGLCFQIAQTRFIERRRP